MNEKIILKPLFKERMQKLLKDEKDFNEYLKIIQVPLLNSIRCNTLKISPEKLKNKLEAKAWKIKQPFKDYPEIMIIENSLQPGELGRSLQHLLGYYYVQEIVSMMPVLALALNPSKDEFVLDLCAAPGSKTTQIAAEMKNKGTIIANEVNLGRIKILASNTERCGVMNCIISKKDGTTLCNKFRKEGILFDKILLDAPCSGEGTLRSSVRTSKMWNPKTIKKMSYLQKNLFEAAFSCLKQGGEIVYSTCTHAPEEDEEIVDFALNRFKDAIKIEKINLPLKCRQGITEWEDKTFSDEVKKACRIYPHDNDTEGFFLAKFIKINNKNIQGEVPS